MIASIYSWCKGYVLRRCLVTKGWMTSSHVFPDKSYIHETIAQRHEESKDTLSKNKVVKGSNLL